MRVNYKSPDAAEKIAEYIKPYLGDKTLIMCIGTDKCIGDCLGPLVGTMLKKDGYPYPIIGTLDDPIHAVNIAENIKRVKEKYPGFFIIAIDATLGHQCELYKVAIEFGTIHPGRGCGKDLPEIGDMKVIGNVDSIEHSDVFTIRAIRLSMVMGMAETIASGLMAAAGHKTVGINKRTKWYDKALAAIKQVAVSREI